MVSPASTDFICIAKVVSSHGLRGLVKIESFMSEVESLDTYGEITIDFKSFRKVNLSHKINPKHAVLKIEGIDSIDEANGLREKNLYVHIDKLPDLDNEDQFYFRDLVGLDVYSSSNNQLYGKIARIHNFGSCDVIEISPVSDSKSHTMHEFTKDMFPKVDIKNRYILLNDLG